MSTKTATAKTAPTADSTAVKDAKAQAQQDARVLGLKQAGATWKFIAGEMGWAWNGANMDGGRGKRAYNRATKAGVTVTLPKALAAKVAKANEKKTRTPKAAAKTPGRTIPTLEECAVKPLTDDGWIHPEG